MPIKITTNECLTRIAVFGVGGEGGNAINFLKDKYPDLLVRTVCVNTDNQDLEKSLADEKILLGEDIQHGRGAGANPSLAAQIVQKEADKLTEALSDTDMVIVCAGLGGGTGSGVSPELCRLAKTKGILTLAIVTVPFLFEGDAKMKIAREYLKKIKEIADAIIVIPNWRLLKERNLSIKKAFEWGNEILISTIKSISTLINSPQCINVDFEDIKTILKNCKDAYISMASITEHMEGGIKTKGELLFDQLMNFPLVDADTIKNIGRAILYVELDENEDVGVLEDIQTRLATIMKKTNNMVIPGIDYKPNLDQVNVTLIAGDFERDDNEYYFSQVNFEQRPNNTLFENNANKRAANMESGRLQNLGTDIIPPRLNSDID